MSTTIDGLSDEIDNLLERFSSDSELKDSLKTAEIAIERLTRELKAQQVNMMP